MPFDEIVALVELVLGKKRVKPDDDLVRDLGAESVEIVSLIAAVEDKFGVSIREEDIGAIRTVGDLFDYVEEQR